jgi:hypothetical protein
LIRELFRNNLETKRLFADGMEWPDKVFFDLGGCLPGDSAGFELLSCGAESGAEIHDAVAEGADSGILLGLQQQRMRISQGSDDRFKIAGF